MKALYNPLYWLERKLHGEMDILDYYILDPLYISKHTMRDLSLCLLYRKFIEKCL